MGSQAKTKPPTKYHDCPFVEVIARSLDGKGVPLAVIETGSVLAGNLTLSFKQGKVRRYLRLDPEALEMLGRRFTNRVEEHHKALGY